MTSTLRRFLVSLGLAMLALPLTVHAQDFPKLTGRVVDAADLLSPADEASIGAAIALMEQRTGHQLAVATIPDLQGYDVADYGYRLGRSWGIGDEKRDDGVVFVIAPNERRMHIGVGYGLEPVLTDVVSGRIIRDTVTPAFKAGDFPGGIKAGTAAIIEQIELPPEEAAARAKAAAEEARQAQSDEDSGDIFIALFWVAIIFFFFVLPTIRAMRGGRKYHGRRGGWGGPVIIWGGGSDSGHRGGGWGGGGGGFGGGFGGGGGFSGGGGSFGGGGASGGW